MLDKLGNVVASDQIGIVKTNDGTPVIPGSEQSVYQIEVADNLTKHSPAEIQYEIRKALLPILRKLPAYIVGGHVPLQ